MEGRVAPQLEAWLAHAYCVSAVEVLSAQKKVAPFQLGGLPGSITDGSHMAVARGGLGGAAGDEAAQREAARKVVLALVRQGTTAATPFRRELERQWAALTEKEFGCRMRLEEPADATVVERAVARKLGGERPNPAAEVGREPSAGAAARAPAGQPRGAQPAGQQAARGPCTWCFGTEGAPGHLQRDCPRKKRNAAKLPPAERPPKAKAPSRGQGAQLAAWPRGGPGGKGVKGWPVAQPGAFMAHPYAPLPQGGKGWPANYMPLAAQPPLALPAPQGKGGTKGKGKGAEQVPEVN